MTPDTRETILFLHPSADRYGVDVAFEGRYAIDIRHEAVETTS